MDGNQDDPKSMLDGLRQHHIVHVFNPLSADFTWYIARTTDHLDQKHRDPYVDNLNLRNQEHPTKGHFQQKITIAAGKSLKLPGDVAKVYVKHLIDEIIAKQGKRNISGDPVLRKETEEQVILNTTDLRDQLTLHSVEEQYEQQIKDLNKDEGITHADAEPAFPGLASSPEDSGSTPEPTPQPGTGTSYTPSKKAAARS